MFQHDRLIYSNIANQDMEETFAPIAKRAQYIHDVMIDERRLGQEQGWVCPSSSLP